MVECVNFDCPIFQWHKPSLKTEFVDKGIVICFTLRECGNNYTLVFCFERTNYARYVKPYFSSKRKYSNFLPL